MNRLRSLLLLLACALLVVSCAPPEIVVTETVSTAPAKTLPPPGATAATDVVKLWTKPRDEHHPLRPNDFQNIALDQLLYEPLFSFTNDGVLKAIVADQASFADDGLSVTITLRDKTFSNGQKLAASDVAASLNVWFQTRRVALELSAPEPVSVPDPVPAPDEYSEPEAADDETPPEVEPETPEQETPEPAPEEEPEPEEPQPQDPDSGGGGSGAPERLELASERAMLQSVTAVETAENNTLKISLNRRIDNILTFLTCPVMTADDAVSLTAPAAPGTAARHIEATDDGHYRLKSNDAKIPAIDVVVYADAEAAIRAFQNGRLDIVFLSPDEYALYGGRQHVRFQSISLPAFLYLSFNTNAGYFADPARLETARALLSWQNKLLDLAVRPHRRMALPVDIDDRRLPFELFDSGYYGKLPTTPIRDADIRLLRGTNRLDTELGENMRLLFERFGYRVTVVDDASAGWDLSLDRYDFAAYPDAYDFFAYAEGGRFASLLSAAPQIEAVLVEGRTAQNRLAENVGPAGIEYKINYHGRLTELMKELPLIGLAAPCGGVAYARRVEGLLTPQYYCLYDGLENLVVWPHP